MAKLTLEPAPRFKKAVAIAVPGGDAVLVEFTFKHRTRTELDALCESLSDRDPVDVLFDIADAWELEAPMNRENVQAFVENYQPASLAVFRTYVSELRLGKLGN